MPILSDSQLSRLKAHKYASTGNTFSDAILQIWWNAVVSKMPLWVAPNLITLTGLFINCVTSALVIGNSLQANSNEVPSKYFFAAGIGLFIYQTLDAIDGKQARRTGTSSPLGELFDHGCDSVSNLVITVSSACAFSMGTFPNYMFFFFINNIALFYLAHWQTYCSGCLIFNKFDVTEVQLQAIFFYIASGFLGPHFFIQQISFLPYNLALIKYMIFLMFIGSCLYSYNAFKHIFHGGVGKNGTTVAQTSVLSPIVPLGIVISCAFYVFKHSGENIFENHPILFMLMFGTSSAKLTCNLIVASMSKSTLDMLDFCMMGPIMLSVYVYFGIEIYASYVNIPISEYYILLLGFLYTISNFVIYCVRICKEISANFGIAILTIPYTRKEN
ncbi:cholinephosphotransferase 1 isoform X2 [Hydra vulgaris]|uniref:Cholinephosphotransferase 1 isoform X2 n=1 Tax=Hydra vulgaris TaxID=6087 RepID=A0ABM4BE58_HYDVU